MTSERSIHLEISGYISALLRTHFGKGPTSVYATVKPPFITIHIRGFIAPMEVVLLKQGESKRVMKTRDVLMNELMPEIIQKLGEIAELDVKELYSDWDLNKETGMIIGIAEEKEEDRYTSDWPENIDKQALEGAINEASEKAEKKPARIDTYMLSERTFLVKRTGILVRIEKELIKNGYTEVLKLAKRPLEHQLLEETDLESILKRKVSELFFDWNFDKDIGYVVITVIPEN